MEVLSIRATAKTAGIRGSIRHPRVYLLNMCGIVGLFAKSPEIEERLGVHLAAMLAQMNDRGPDSAGVAVYRDPAPSGSSKLTLYSADPQENWAEVAAVLEAAFGGFPDPSVRASHAVFVVDADAAEAETWVRKNRPDLRVMSAGAVIEIYKEIGPARVRGGIPADRPPRDARVGAHAHGHREPGDDRGISSFLDRLRPLPRSQRLAVEPQSSARESAP